MKWKQWAAFCLAGLLWGTSFVWIKIALREIGPFMLVSYRLSFGALGLIGVLWWFGLKFPRDQTTWKKIITMCLLNPVIPFILISWGETKIDSSMASILNGCVPLCTIVIAHLFLKDERMTPSKVASLCLGFLGVLTLVSRELNLEGILGYQKFLGQLAVLGAAILYACSAVYSRRMLRNINPIVQAASLMSSAAVLSWLILPLFENPFHVPTLLITWIALAWMGLLGTCVAFVSYFYLLNSWGATRSVVVNYVFPVIGLLLGIVFLGEKADGRLLLGSLMIVISVLVLNWKAIKSR